MKELPNKIYTIRWNLGGFLHDKIYTLSYQEEYEGYWDKEGDTGGINKKDLRRYLDKEVDVRNIGCWYYYTSSLREAQAILLGAKTTKKFLKGWID